MSKKRPTPTQQLKMDFTIDLSSFCQNIKSNFSLIWQTLNRQSQQLQSLRSEMVLDAHNAQKYPPTDSRNSHRRAINNVSLNYSEVSQDQKDGIEREGKINPENGLTQSRVIKAEGEESTNTGKKLVNELTKNLKHEQQIIKPRLSQPQNKNQGPKQIIDEKQPAAVPEPEANQQQKPVENKLDQLMQDKILQMNERLYKLELASVKQNSTFSKKINQINNQLDRSIEALNKKQSQIKKLQFQIQKFRGELSQYKLKKQSQIMRLSNSAVSSSASSSRQYNEYLLQKIQEISNIIPELMVRADFDQYKAEMKVNLGKIQRRIGGMVSNQEFQGLMAILNRKKTDNLGAIGRVNRENSRINSMDNKMQPEIVLDQVDPALELKLISLQKQIKELSESQKQSHKFLQQKAQKQADNLSQTNLKLSQALNQISRSQHKSQQYEDFMRNMNESYNQKIKQIINQIIQAQQSIQKLNNQMKFYSYTKGSNSEGPVGPTSHSSGGFADGTKIVDMENDVNLLKKKVNKLTLKQQSLKEDLLTVRQDFARETDGLKSLLEKKCDWDSLKKGMHYFEERVKEIVNYIDILQKNISQPEDNGESTAAKKGWTCLCCDKDIKQYEGKIGQAKFTSIFPTRYQSPRIGGYFKQKQGQKQYNQVFLKHNRRLSQNQTKSRDELI